ncbi:MAG: GntP family permease [Deltaproteobacteria bacterium]|jgi:H+/gluconate symporter-like permease|nr:GntP family permease [Deltaproteobacteria bacterium]
MAMLGVIGLLGALVLLVILAYKGLHIIAVSLICSLFVIFTNQLPIWDTLSNGYMGFLKNFVGSYLLMFFLGAVFGELIGQSGAARSISFKIIDLFGPAKAILVVILATTILSYGGVSVFVIIFAIYPIGLFLFKEADVNKKLLPATVLLGSGAYVLTTVPGTPALPNVIPTNPIYHLGTNLYAAPVVSIIATIVMFVSGYLYLLWADRRYRSRNEGFVPSPGDVIEELTPETRAKLPSCTLSLLPIIVLIAVIFFTKSVLPAMAGVCLALLSGVVLSCIVFFPQLKPKFTTCLNTGAGGSILAIINTASVVGFGGVVQTAPAFQSFVKFASELDFNPLVSTAIAVNVVAGITGSSSGGTTIFMNSMSEIFMQMGTINPEVFHRIVAISSGCLDSLPHSGAIITFLVITKLTHKQAYSHMGMVTCVVPMLGLIAAIIAGSMGLV